METKFQPFTLSEIITAYAAYQGKKDVLSKHDRVLYGAVINKKIEHAESQLKNEFSLEFSRVDTDGFVLLIRHCLTGTKFNVKQEWLDKTQLSFDEVNDYFNEIWNGTDH